MKPPLTLTLLISADGKTATRSGESLISCASPEYLNRVAESRSQAGCLLIDTSLPPYEIPRETSAIILGSAESWQAIIDTLDQEKLVVIEDTDDFSAEKLQQLAQSLNASDVHCEPSAQLARELLKESIVDTLNLTVIHSIVGGHAADTITGNGAASAFLHSLPFSLISHEQTDNEVNLRYAFKSHPNAT